VCIFNITHTARHLIDAVKLKFVETALHTICCTPLPLGQLVIFNVCIRNFHTVMTAPLIQLVKYKTRYDVMLPDNFQIE
jgi:hypothetical protein